MQQFIAVLEIEILTLRKTGARFIPNPAKTPAIGGVIMVPGGQ